MERRDLSTRRLFLCGWLVSDIPGQGNTASDGRAVELGQIRKAAPPRVASLLVRAFFHPVQLACVFVNKGRICGHCHREPLAPALDEIRGRP